MIFYKNRFPLGWQIIVASLGLTLVIWLTTLSSYRFIYRDPFLFLSKIAALTGTISLCWSFILSTRIRIFETLFAGLDKTYHAHRSISITGFLLICLHPIFQFFRFVPDWKMAFGLFIPRELGPTELGFLGFIVFVLLIACTLWIQIPYHIWKRTHEFFILVLLLAFLHVWFIDKQVNSSILLSLWMYGFFAIAGISYVYIRFLYHRIGPRFQYAVERIEKVRKTWNVYLIPFSEKHIDYKPAQFVYISFDNKQLGSEAHPFSVSSWPGQPLRLTIKNLGDYTSRLDSLKPHDEAWILGPYGRFYENYLYRPEKNAIMIAGGIGITPFLSMLSYEAAHPKKRTTYIFYCVKNRERADFHEELLSYSKENPFIEYRLCLSELGDLNVEKIKESINGTLRDYHFFLCGPLEMMKFFEKELKKAGVKNRNITFEDFNLLD